MLRITIFDNSKLSLGSNRAKVISQFFPFYNYSEKFFSYTVTALFRLRWCVIVEKIKVSIFLYYSNSSVWCHEKHWWRATDHNITLFIVFPQYLFLLKLFIFINSFLLFCLHNHSHLLPFFFPLELGFGMISTVTTLSMEIMLICPLQLFR